MLAVLPNGHGLIEVPVKRAIDRICNHHQRLLWVPCGITEIESNTVNESNNTLRSSRFERFSYENIWYCLLSARRNELHFCLNIDIGTIFGWLCPLVIVSLSFIQQTSIRKHAERSMLRSRWWRFCRDYHLYCGNGGNFPAEVGYRWRYVENNTILYLHMKASGERNNRQSALS